MPNSFLADELHLIGENSTAKVAPLGASLTQLNIGGTEVIAQVTMQTSTKNFAGVTLAPWPNRLAGGCWQHNGQTLCAPINDSAGNANHGLLFDRQFAVLKHTKNFVQFSAVLGSEAVYPFDVEILVSYEMVNGELVSTLTAKNHGSDKAPVAFGSHPYVTVSKTSTVEIHADLQAVNNENQIPVAFEPATKNKSASGEAPAFAELRLDDCFTNLNFDSSGIATTTINNVDGSRIQLWQEALFKYLMVYTIGSQLALEPQTAPANALNSGTDLIWLEPGDSISASWGIRVIK